MNKDNILVYLEKQLEKELSEKYDFGIDWDTRNHTIEVIIHLFAENKTSQKIEDRSGVVAEEVIEFEDSILFYNPQKSVIQADDYLAVLPYEGKKGLPKSTVACFARYLKEVLDQGQENLNQFLSDEELPLFELVWQAKEYESRLAEVVESKEFVPYPRY